MFMNCSEHQFLSKVSVIASRSKVCLTISGSKVGIGGENPAFTQPQQDQASQAEHQAACANLQ